MIARSDTYVAVPVHSLPDLPVSTLLMTQKEKNIFERTGRAEIGKKETSVPCHVVDMMCDCLQKRSL